MFFSISASQRRLVPVVQIEAEFCNTQGFEGTTGGEIMTFEVNK